MPSLTVSSLRIIATGGHSGLGFEALKSLLATSLVSDATKCHLILLARHPTSPAVVAARQKLLDQFNAHVLKHSRNDGGSGRNPSSTNQNKLKIDTRQMDLSCLSSVRKAASLLRQDLDADSDASWTEIYLLNAAVAKTKKELVTDESRALGEVSYPADDMLDGRTSMVETTACVNHIAHLLFITQLSSYILERRTKGKDTRLVFTGSGLHQSIKNVDDLDTFFSSRYHHLLNTTTPSGSDDATKSTTAKPWTLRDTYAASKFLQMLGIRAFRRKLHQQLSSSIAASSTSSSTPSAGQGTGKLEMVVVQPGFVPQTGLSRETGFLTRIAMSYLLPWAPFATTPDAAGRYIANACYMDISQASEAESEPDSDLTEQERLDGFHTSTISAAESTSDATSSPSIKIKAALLEVKNGKQQFGRLNHRTADLKLQRKWWPNACGEFS